MQQLGLTSNAVERLSAMTGGVLYFRPLTAGIMTAHLFGFLFLSQYRRW
jgi:hypothetical protein